MKFTYKAVTTEGKIIRGIVEAKEVKEAAIYLRNRGFLPIKITSTQNKLFAKYFTFLNRIKTSDLVFFTRQLSSMLNAGLTLMQALNILKDQVQNDFMKEIVNGIVAEIEEGRSFSIAISKYPDVFPGIYVSLIKAGEASGLLDKILARLAENLEKQEKLRSTIKSAMIYPAIIIVGMIGVMLLMMIFVMPQLEILYVSLGVTLPLPTQIVLGISKFITNFWFLVIGLTALFGYLYRRWHKTESGQLIIDDLVLKLPIFGKIIRNTILTEFTRTLGLLIGAGSLVVESLTEISGITGNIHYKNAIIGVSKRVEHGITVGDAMGSYALFPPIIVQMVKIGEETGKMDDSLSRVSEYYEREVDQAVKTLTTAMEPVIMVMLGIGVAFLIISVITPIYKLTSSL